MYASPLPYIRTKLSKGYISYPCSSQYPLLIIEIMAPLSIKALLIIPSISTPVLFALTNILAHGLGLYYPNPFNTPTGPSSSLMWIHPWSSLGEDWRVTFPPLLAI